MIYGIGTDLLDLERIRHWLEDHKYISRILSKEEIEFFQSINSLERKLTYLGGRFAAKEAIFKAMSHTENHTNFNDLCILNDPHGKPYLKSHPFDSNFSFIISISHTEKQAIAFVICERV